MPANFAYFLFVRELPELLAATNALEARLRAAGKQAGADLVLRAYTTLRAELEAMSVNVAAKGTEILRRHEKESRERPDTGGEGGPRLEDNLDCDPLPVVWGSVGIANEDTLDQNVPWWSTNEEGSSARIGGVLRGVFEPGESAPQAALFRQHPIFEPVGGGPRGIIHNPIPARRFILHAIPEIDALWLAQFDAIKAAFIAEIEVAQALP